MGAGAGYTIEVSDAKVVSSVDVSTFTLEKDGGYCTATVPCDVKLSATLSGGSYYDGIGEIANVALTVTSVVIALEFGNGFNDDLLTPEAIDKYERQFGEDINSLWRELVDVVEPSDININFIREEMSYGINYNGEARLGGGWVGSTFDGIFTAELDGRGGSNELLSADMLVDEDFVIDFIDKAKYGDNLEYTVFYNDDIMDSYSEKDEAIAALKKEIISDIENADLDGCYVEENRYYLRDGGADTYEYETDWDYSEVVYNADADFDIDAIEDIISEMDEENNPNFDEGFDI